MIKCDNCSNEATYTCADPGVNPVNYCSSCLPVWLQHRAAAGHFPLVQPVKVEEPTAPSAEEPVEEVEAPKKSKPKKDE